MLRSTHPIALFAVAFVTLAAALPASAASYYPLPVIPSNPPVTPLPGIPVIPRIEPSLLPVIEVTPLHNTSWSVRVDEDGNDCTSRPGKGTKGIRPALINHPVITGDFASVESDLHRNVQLADASAAEIWWRRATRSRDRIRATNAVAGVRG